MNQEAYPAIAIYRCRMCGVEYTQDTGRSYPIATMGIINTVHHGLHNCNSSQAGVSDLQGIKLIKT